MTRKVAMGLAALGGVVVALASPPFDFYAGLWVGMAALAVALRPVEGGAAVTGTRAARLARRLRGGGRGALFGLMANLLAFRFVPEVVTRFTPLPWVAGVLALVLLAASQGLRFFVTGIVHQRLTERGVPRWVAFPLGIYAGTFFPMVFPWTVAGGVTPWPAMVQLADVIGERGVTGLMALAAGLLAEVVGAAPLRRRLVMGGAAAGLPLLTAAHGHFAMARADARRVGAPTLRVALVSPATEASIRWERGHAATILGRLTQLTREAERHGTDLTIWPEAAYPYTLSHRSRRAPFGDHAVLGTGVRGPVLTGTLTADEGESYNAAVLVAPDGSMGEPYAKMHLLWFGEQVPLADVFPWFRRVFARGVGLAPGAHQVLLVSGPMRAAVLNCFEDTLPGAGREALALEPNLLVNLTNDGWFAGQPPPVTRADVVAAFSLESELHLRMAVMRSVEGRRDMVRAVNLGPTAWVDATGRVRARHASFMPGVLHVEPALLQTPPTAFARWGDAPWAASCALLGGALLRRARRTSAQPRQPVSETTKGA